MYIFMYTVCFAIVLNYYVFSGIFRIKKEDIFLTQLINFRFQASTLEYLYTSYRDYWDLSHFLLPTVHIFLEKYIGYHLW